MSVSELIEEVFDVKADSLDPEQKLTDMEEWDSMNHMVLISRIEEEFGVELEQDDVLNMTSVSAIEKILEQKESA